MLYFTVTLNNRKLHSIQEHGPNKKKRTLQFSVQNSIYEQ